MFQTLNVRALIGGLCAAAALLLTACDDIHDTTLANGLRVIVKEDHRSPVVISLLMYKVGSVDEPEGLTGISHVLEHMLFKGTKRFGPNEFSRIIAENGGRENAFTSYDYTGYFQQLEKSRLPIAFDLEADRMRNALLDEDEFKKEIQVVIEERRLRIEDQPESRVYEKFIDEAYRVHPYGDPIIGHMRDLERMTIKDVREWYKRWYTPNNAVLVVVGDVEPRAVVELAQKYYGPIPVNPLERTPVPAEPPQENARRATVSVPAQVPYLLMGYHTPILQPDTASGAASWEPYALSVLSGVLDGGESARLERELIRGRRIASRVGADYSAVSRYPSMMLFSGTPSSDKTVADLEAALREQVERVRKEPVTDAELERVKAQVVAGEVYRRDSVYGQAMEIGRLAMTGLDLNLIEERVKRLSAVTPEQVMQVARKYLTPDKLTVVTLDPLPLDDKQPAPRSAGGRHGH